MYSEKEANSLPTVLKAIDRFFPSLKGTPEVPGSLTAVFTDGGLFLRSAPDTLNQCTVF
jgi:hypothetical protein